MDYYKIGEVKHDFANANRMKAAYNAGIYSIRPIMAKDADGKCYKFANAIEAAKEVVKNGYSTAAPRFVKLNIVKAARRNGNVKNGVTYGFEWNFIENGKDD
jgi:hypothetical protein